MERLSRDGFPTTNARKFHSAARRSRSSRGKRRGAGLIDDAVGLKAQGSSKRFCSILRLFLGRDEKNRGISSHLTGIIALRERCHQPFTAVFKLQSNGQL